MKIKADLETEYAAWRSLNTQDFYSAGVVKFCEAWSDLMEARMLTGSTVADCAKDTSNEADAAIGISGFMYGCAVEALARFWEHGEALRVWHNLGTQMGTEGVQANESGAVLNPALIVIDLSPATP